MAVDIQSFCCCCFNESCKNYDNDRGRVCEGGINKRREGEGGEEGTLEARRWREEGTYLEASN